jgi:hypothetical protein
MLEFIFDLLSFVSFGGIGVVISLVFAVWMLGIWAWSGIVWLGGAIRFTWNVDGTRAAFAFYLPYLCYALFRGNFISASIYSVLFIVVFCYQYNWGKKMAKIN